MSTLPYMSILTLGHCISKIPYTANFLRWKNFVDEEMSCNLLENIHGCMVVLCDQTLLHKGIIANSLERFHVYIIDP